MREEKKNDMRYADLVTVWTGENANAAVIKALLEGYGLRAVTNVWMPGGLFPNMMTLSGMRVEVLAPYAESAAQIIENSRRQAAGELELIRVLFICTHNRFRSQMAEGWLDALGGGRFDVFSAGADPQGPAPIAIEIMSEVGIDISNHTGRNVSEFVGEKMDYVITVCDSANESCPSFPGQCERLHWSFDDPSKFTGTPDEVRRKMREVRDAIRARIVEFIKTARKTQSSAQDDIPTL